jgi:uncharacterized repeat protein (TIGR01451 family)
MLNSLQRIRTQLLNSGHPTAVRGCLSFAVAGCLLFSQQVLAAVTPANTPITNTAVASFERSNGLTDSVSSSATLVTEEINPAAVAPTPAEMLLLHNGGSSASGTAINGSECADSSGNFSALTAFTDLSGNAQSLPGSYQLNAVEYGFKIGEPLIIQVVELDKNLNSARPDQIEIDVRNSNGSDIEHLRLTETGDNTGIFVGVLPTRLADASATNYDCALSLKYGQTVTARYQDSADSTDSVTLNTRFDPYSRVFDSQTGAPVNGVTVTLINADTGLAARGFDDDGVTPWPASVVTGPKISAQTVRTAALASDTNSFPDGSFRFPYVPSGNYQLQFEAPAKYRVPSELGSDDLNNVPNGPFELNTISRGEVFSLAGGRVFISDIAADPLEGGVLLSKTANKNEAGIGDFVQFTIRLNNSQVVVKDASIVDQLPQGMRLRNGSVRINDEKIADPVISNNGRQLTFALPDIAANGSLLLTYVTQITAQAQGALINKAWLVDDDVSSNIAQAQVQIADEFFKDSARLFGRVYLDDCNGNLDAEAVSNVRLFMEDGTYVVTDANGEWHIENVRPGTHVVQLDTATIPPYMEVVSCDERGFHAGRAFSQFVDVQGGSFWRVDFALKMKTPESGEIRQRLSHQLVPLAAMADGKLPYNSPVPEKLRFTVDLEGNGLEVNNVIQMIALPDGVIYEPGSSVLDNVPWEDPQISYGTLIYKLGDKPADWSHQLQFSAIVSDKADSGELTTRSITRFQAEGQPKQQIKPASTTAVLQLPPDDGQVKPINPPKFDNFSDVLTPEDKSNLKNVIDRLAGLRNLTVQVVGHTDSTPIARRNKHIYADNQALSEARASSVARYLAEQLGVEPQNIRAVGKGSSVPVASNASRDGRALNRRVEVKVLSGDPDIRLATIASDMQVASVQASLPGFIRNLPATAAGNPAALIAEQPMPEFDQHWFETAADQAQWLWPPLDRSPSIGSVKIAISHGAGERIKLLLDDQPVSPLNFDGTTRNSKRDLAVSIWRGVDIQPGPNRFSVFVINKDGDIVDQFERTVQYAQEPAKAELVESQSNAVADGLTPATIAVRLTDKDGFPIRANILGDVEVQAPYTLYDESRQIEGNPLGNIQQPQYRVGDNGVALIRLTPTNQAGEAVLTFRHANGQKDELRVWLKPAPRDWILVGLGDLAVGYNSGNGDHNSRQAAGVDDNLWHDGRVAFFAQGQVLGEWLLTAAYDSGKPEAEAFASVIEPDRYYTLYGDASQQQLDASSARKLYVRLERERFYAMFGDINTDLNNSTLGRYSRKLTGAQADYHGDVGELSAFTSQTSNGFVRDEIQGDGTSGLYRLRNKNIVLNSEKIRIETRDRYRSEVIISSEDLNRDADYVIDYQDGTLYFKGPVSSTDENFNPRYIVVEYETEAGDNLGYISGGRAGVKLLDERIKAGVTAITQNQSGDDRHLTAADARITLGDTEIKAEIAQSEEVVNSAAATANAHLLEVTHRTEQLQATAYVRSQDENFGLDQTAQGENDYRKEGVQGSYYLSDRDRLQLEGFHHQQLSTGFDKYQTQLDWVHRLDNDQQISFGLLSAQEENETEDQYTDQLTAGFSTRVLNDRLTLNSMLLANASARSDAYDQLRLGADYRLTNDLSLFAEHETGFESAAPERTVLGMRATPWSGAKAQQSIEQVEQDDAYRLFAVSGLTQEVALSDALSVSLGFDQARNLEANAPGETSDSTEDFHATHAGMSYRTSLWQWNNRVEYRDGSDSDKWVARTSLYHPLNDALATGGSLNYFKEDGSSSYSNQLEASFDLAIRPRRHPYALLWQTRWVQQAEGGEGTPSRSRKLINNVHGNWLFTPANQLAAQYGIKRVLDQYNSDDYASTTDFMAAEWRHHLNPTWDIGAHGRRLHSYEAGQTAHGTGVSVGWIPQTNVWLGLGYNFTGFIDTDFSAANFTAKGVYLKMRFKADQETLATLRAAFY